MEMQGPQQRLRELAGQRGISLSRLSALIDRNPSYLQQFVGKGSPRKLEENDRRTLARFFGVDEAELGAVEEISSDSGKFSPRQDWVDVPRLALGASAGPGAIAGDEEAIGVFRFAASWVRGQGLEPAMLTAIAVMGDSMDPTLRDGDEILVDCRLSPLCDGIHVLRLDGSVLVKRLDTARPGVLTLSSDNPAYRSIVVNPGEVEIVGRVVWKSGRL